MVATVVPGVNRKMTTDRVVTARTKAGDEAREEGVVQHGQQNIAEAAQTTCPQAGGSLVN